MRTQYTITPCNETNCAEWNNFVLNHPQCHRMKTSLWADTKQSNGWVTYILTARHNGTLVGGAQLYEHRIPVFGSLVCLPKGPLCESCHEDIMPQLLSQIKKWGHINHKFCLLVQPADQEQYLVDQLLYEKFSKLADENIVPPGTIIINLEPDEHTLFKKLSHSKQGNVRRSREAGISVKEGNSQDIETFYTLYLRTSEYLHFEPDCKTRFENIWRILYPQGHIRLFISYFEDQPVSAIILLCFGSTATCWRFGWTKEHAEKRPNEALYWHTILWAKEQGFQFFDFGEIELGAAKCLCNDHHLPEEYKCSSVRFKLAFGGTPVLYPETYVYFPNAIVRWLYDTILCKIMNHPVAQKILAVAAG
jgi:lipid II:glycine glycyltransferase (peptidoglycan interpeptide bridge formation enzyme)